jgi:hypothetical protein
MLAAAPINALTSATICSLPRADAIEYTKPPSVVETEPDSSTAPTITVSHPNSWSGRPERLEAGSYGLGATFLVRPFCCPRLARGAPCVLPAGILRCVQLKHLIHEASHQRICPPSHFSLPLLDVEGTLYRRCVSWQMLRSQQPHSVMSYPTAAALVYPRLYERGAFR